MRCGLAIRRGVKLSLFAVVLGLLNLAIPSAERPNAYVDGIRVQHSLETSPGKKLGMKVISKKLLQSKKTEGQKQLPKKHVISKEKQLIGNISSKQQEEGKHINGKPHNPKMPKQSVGNHKAGKQNPTHKKEDEQKQTQIKQMKQVLPKKTKPSAAVKSIKQLGKKSQKADPGKEKKPTGQRNTQEQQRDSDRRRSLLKESGGYIIYCPCMGRFGNQAETFLGSLAFAKKINRTMLLPHWRAGPGQAYSKWFSLARLRKYHRVMEVSDFTSGPDAHLWSLQSQKLWCASSSTSTCGLENVYTKNYWTNMGFHLDGIFTYNQSISAPQSFKQTYRASQYPLIAMNNAPGRFPALKQDLKVQAFIQWSDPMLATVKDIVSKSFKSQPYIGIHIRNHDDWKKTCNLQGQHISFQFMAAYQCEDKATAQGYKEVPHQVCFPAANSSLIVRQLRSLVKATRIRNVFVAAELDGTVKDIEAGLKDLKVTVARRKTENTTKDPVTDLAVLTEAKHFIGNCVSSYSAFVTRYRQARNRPVAFWGL